MGCYNFLVGTIELFLWLMLTTHVNSFRLQKGKLAIRTPIHMVKEFNKEQLENEINIPKSIKFINNEKSLAVKKDLTVFVVDCSLNGRSSSTKRRIDAVQGFSPLLYLNKILIIFHVSAVTVSFLLVCL